MACLGSPCFLPPLLRDLELEPDPELGRVTGMVTRGRVTKLIPNEAQNCRKMPLVKPLLCKLSPQSGYKTHRHGGQSSDEQVAIVSFSQAMGMYAVETTAQSNQVKNNENLLTHVSRAPEGPCFWVSGPQGH